MMSNGLLQIIVVLCQYVQHPSMPVFGPLLLDIISGVLSGEEPENTVRCADLSDGRSQLTQRVGNRRLTTFISLSGVRSNRAGGLSLHKTVSVVANWSADLFLKTTKTEVDVN